MNFRQGGIKRRGDTGTSFDTFAGFAALLGCTRTWLVMTPRAALFGALFRAGTAVFSILFPRLGPWFSAFSSWNVLPNTKDIAKMSCVAFKLFFSFLIVEYAPVPYAR